MRKDHAEIIPDGPLKEVIRTVTREELLHEGSDAIFRELINNLLLMSKQLQTLRTEMADQLGVSEPQYRVFTTVLLLQGDGGVSVGTVASALHVTGAFVTAESGRLVRMGLLQKTSDEADRRSVLLSVSAKGARRFQNFVDSLRRVNDELFRDLTREEFLFFSGLIRRLVMNGARASLLAKALVTEETLAREHESADFDELQADDASRFGKDAG